MERFGNSVYDSAEAGKENIGNSSYESCTVGRGHGQKNETILTELNSVTIKDTWKKFGSPEINFSWWDLKLNKMPRAQGQNIRKWPKRTFRGPIWVPKYFPVLAILGALWVPESKF